MKRLGLLFGLVGFLALPAFAEEVAATPQAPVVRPNAQAAQPPQNQQPNPQQQLQNQIRVMISSVYAQRLREAAGLTDDQFLKMSFFIQSFIDGRFMAAMRRDNLNQRMEQFRSQPNRPPDVEEELILQQRQMDMNFGNMENQFLQKIRPDLKSGQALLIIAFNTKFFEEDLPDLIEQAREAAQRRQEQPAARPNLNNRQSQPQTNPARPGNAILPKRN